MYLSNPGTTFPVNIRIVQYLAYQVAKTEQIIGIFVPLKRKSMKSINLFSLLIFTTLSVFLFNGCTKEAGEGGTSTITGKVLVYDFDASFQTVVDTYPLVDEDVYIIYGDDNSTYNDNYKTSYDGTFEFKFLQKGKYKLFAYSKDSTGAAAGNLNSNSPKIAKFAEVEITSNGSVVTSPTIIVLDNNY